MSAVPALAVDASAGPAIQVLVVDDSLVIRGLIARMLKDAPGIEVAATVSDGAKAVDRVAKGGIDVVVLDIEMPVMDGLTALPKLLAIDRNLVVIMASTLTTRNAEISITALNLGASDYVPKPTSTSEINNAQSFREELIGKVRALGARRRGRRATATKFGAAVAKPQPAAVGLRAPSATRPHILAVGSSTGGPKALSEFLVALPKSFPLPVVITQHMPPTFTRILAGSLARDTGRSVVEAVDGDIVAPGTILIAPGDFHMRTVRTVGGELRVKLDTGEKENFCRPSVDPMLRSLVDVYGGRVLLAMLTGMGRDGFKGAEVVVAAGGTVVAQDETSSVVWGMPGAVAQGGLCSCIAAPADLARAVAALAEGHVP